MTQKVQPNDSANPHATHSDHHALSYRQVVGDMYSQWALDCVIEIAYAVSKDFIARPEFYKTDDVPNGIADLRAAYGSISSLPNRTQRQDINSPIFGASDGYPSDNANDKFRALRKPLFDACTVYLMRTNSDAAAPVKETVLSALDSFQSRLRNFDGASIRRSHHQVSSVFSLSCDVLRSEGVSDVFGVSPPPAGAWPLDSNDGNGSLLIRAIGEKLQLAPEHVFNEEKFQRLRRIAQQGRIALHSILHEDPAGEHGFDKLVKDVYSWAVSLKDYWGR
jgi:hypothetical protein